MMQAYSLIRARAVLAMLRALRSDDFDESKHPRDRGKFSSGAGSSGETAKAPAESRGSEKAGARVVRARESVKVASTNAATIAVKHRASEEKRQASVAAADGALKEAKKAAAKAKRSPTEENVGTWQTATRKAITARKLAEKHTGDAERHGEMRAKAQTAHAIAVAKLTEAQRAASAPRATGPRSIQVNPRGVGFSRVHGEGETGALELTPAPEFSFGVGISAIRGHDEQPAIEHPKAAAPTLKRETVLEMLSRTRPTNVRSAPKPPQDFDPKRKQEIAKIERDRKSAEVKIRAQRAIALADIPGVAAILPGHRMKPAPAPKPAENKSAYEITQRLPTNWKPTHPPIVPEPRRRYPRNTASMAVTERLPTVRA